MANRVNRAEVEEIIEIDPAITSIDAFITAANIIINQECTDPSLGTAQLKEIERWLSAHMVAIRDMRKDTEKADVVMDKNQYKLGLNLQVTMYGQQAMMLDTSGALTALSNSKGKVSTGFVSYDIT